MGVKIFRNGNWERLLAGVVSGADFRELDPEKDCELLGYLLRRASQRYSDRVMEKYGIADIPEKPVNIDAPNDAEYEPYFVLLEQVKREEEKSVLREATFSKERTDQAKFAFCRLTGYRYCPSACDAYSYRTFDCGRMEGITDEEAKTFCQDMIDKKGPFCKEAEELLRDSSEKK